MPLCPFCGAYSPTLCELIEDAGHCPWEEMEDAISAEDFRAACARDEQMLREWKDR